MFYRSEIIQNLTNWERIQLLRISPTQPWECLHVSNSCWESKTSRRPMIEDRMLLIKFLLFHPKLYLNIYIKFVLENHYHNQECFMISGMSLELW